MWLRTESMITPRFLDRFVVFNITEWSWAETVICSSLAPTIIISVLSLLTEENSGTSNHWFIQCIYPASVWDYSPLVIWLCKFVCHNLHNRGNTFCCFQLSELEGAFKCWTAETPEWSPGVPRMSFLSTQMCNKPLTQSSCYHLDRI